MAVPMGVPVAMAVAVAVAVAVVVARGSGRARRGWQRRFEACVRRLDVPQLGDCLPEGAAGDVAACLIPCGTHGGDQVSDGPHVISSASEL